jgi:hypothetical protein
VCKELGFTCALSWSADETWEIQNSYTIALDNLNCMSDNFTECTFDLSHNCGHAEDIFLTCSYKCLTRGSDIRAKLVDVEGIESTNGQGLLLVTSKVDDIVCHFLAGYSVTKWFGCIMTNLNQLFLICYPIIKLKVN